MSELPGVRADDALELVPMDPSCATEYLAAVERNIDRLAEWEPWAQQSPTIESIREFQTAVAASIARGELLDFAIRLDGRVAGSLGSRLGGDRAEIRYWIDRDLEGRGVAFRAVTELIERLHALGRDRLEAHVAVANARSIRLLERLGFAPDAAPLEPLRLGERTVPMRRFVRG